MVKYDVVVVGAGNAGLIAALETAKAGKKTLLIEQHNLPGGCATSFSRGRFEFDPSLHELCGVGTAENPGNVRLLLDSLGVNVEWCTVPDCFRVITKYSDGGAMDVTMPSGVQPFIDKMEEYVPGSRSSMEDFFELLTEIDEGIAFLSSGEEASNKELFTRFGNVLRVGSHNCKDVFNALGIPQRAQDILSTYWSYLGVDMTHLGFLHYACMVHGYIKDGAAMPAHTSHAISVAATERLRELGGDIWFNCRATEFVFNGDKCCGVKTTMGDIECDMVLANINPDIIYGKMVPKEIIPEREKKLSAARNKNYGARMFTVHMGLNKTAEQLGIKDYSIFLPGTSVSEQEYKNVLAGEKTNEYGIFLCYNVVKPDYSPEGTCECSITTFMAAEDWNDVAPAEYAAKKTAMAKKLIAVLKRKAGIDIAPYIEEIAISSPLTFARYLNAPEGSVYGYETTDWDGLMARMMSVGKDYPIKGLKPIGTSGPRGDGYSSAYYCGQMIAQMALKEMEQGGNN
ncbi:MAG: NAD(P)/FAD-dependent oxidoreductase [Clostridia bacterium]|nr:NAD(P)/FAD-dependent oxidoreductase [Clostridia bacterium]